MFLEVIATCFEECEVINQAGNVDRIELCSNLARGGFTPPYDVIEKCCKSSKIPIRVIIRHSDENFYCDNQEFELLKQDIFFVKTTKAEGVVIGIITRDHEVDVDRMKALIALASPLKITFHRAFDHISDKLKAVKTLAKLQVSTILTQGGEDPIANNLKVLQSLRGFGVQIQGGSGVNLNNFKLVSEYCDSIHVGSSVRIDNSWEKEIDICKIKLFE